MRKFIFILLVAFFLAIYFYSTENENDNWLHQGVSQVKMTINSLKLSKSATPQPSLPTENDEVQAKASLGGSEVAFDNMDRQQFLSWVRSESKSMNSARHNTQEIQLRLKTQVKELSPQQLESLKDMTISAQLPINERILANYLLTLSDSPQALESAVEVAKSAVPDYGPSLPHSEAEIRNTQELALRYMQVDQLYELAKTDTDARDKLKLLMSEASSEQVRNYAQKKYFELK